MLFNSIDFLIFFPIVVLLYWIVPRKIRYIWLLIASYYFYMNWNVKYALLIGTSTIITWLCGLGMDVVRRNGGVHALRIQKLIAAVGLLSNLGILFFFKYAGFALENVNRVLAMLHVGTIDRSIDVLLPVGISFYTFQALGYMIDVYRGDIEAERNPLRYALFVSFFPQLVAGPIERSGNLLKQIREIPEKKVTAWNQVINGLIVMLYGFFMKVVIADRIAIMVDEVFEHAYMYGTIELIVAAVGFAIQIYCDFGSYSMIAIGAAQVMGFTLMENFNTPYFSCSIKEFWRRWHISLSTWFRDYLYIPLGGNRCGKIRKYVNLMITFLVSGLWHGASWNYVIWGGIHGCYQVAGEVLRPIRGRVKEALKINTECDSYKLGQIFSTFLLTTFAWIFFRADSLRMAWIYIERMFTNWNPWVLFDGSLYELGLDRVEMNVLIVALVVLLLVDLVRYRKNMRIDVYLEKQNRLFVWLVAIVMIVVLVVYGEYGLAASANQFIYFQF